MCESSKVINYKIWQQLTEFMLDVIRAPEVGTQKIPTPHQVA